MICVPRLYIHSRSYSLTFYPVPCCCPTNHRDYITSLRFWSSWFLFLIFSKFVFLRTLALYVSHTNQNDYGGNEISTFSTFLIYVSNVKLIDFDSCHPIGRISSANDIFPLNCGLELKLIKMFSSSVYAYDSYQLFLWFSFRYSTRGWLKNFFLGIRVKI